VTLAVALSTFRFVAKNLVAKKIKDRQNQGHSAWDFYAGVDLVSTAIQVNATSTGADYERLADVLIECYSQVDKKAQLLPSASIMPVIKLLWYSVLLYFALLGDFILIIPINIVIAIRNIFPGRWSYRSFCWRYIKAVVHWIWVGEYSVPFIPFRALTIFLLHWHFRGRLSMFRRRVLLETRFSEDIAKTAFAKIDSALNFWGQSSPARIFLTWGPPLIGLLPIELVKFMSPSRFPPWGQLLAIFSFGYLLAIPLSAFVAKRGLMLGGAGREAYYPGFLQGSGYYTREREVLSAIGLATSEFPLDIALIIASLFFTQLTYSQQMEGGLVELLGWLGLPVPVESPSLALRISSIIVVVTISAIALVRRKKCGRL